jgi:hypothetical protein
MNKQELTVALNERTGFDLRPHDIRKAGDWVFVRRPEWPDEAECYSLPLDLIAEPWSDVPINRSPFAGEKEWALISDSVLSDLNTGWSAYLKEIEGEEEE